MKNTKSYDTSKMTRDEIFSYKYDSKTDTYWKKDEMSYSEIARQVANVIFTAAFIGTMIFVATL